MGLDAKIFISAHALICCCLERQEGKEGQGAKESEGFKRTGQSLTQKQGLQPRKQRKRQERKKKKGGLGGGGRFCATNRFYFFDEHVDGIFFEATHNGFTVSLPRPAATKKKRCSTTDGLYLFDEHVDGTLFWDKHTTASSYRFRGYAVEKTRKRPQERQLPWRPDHDVLPTDVGLEGGAGETWCCQKHNMIMPLAI